MDRGKQWPQIQFIHRNHGVTKKCIQTNRHCRCLHHVYYSGLKFLSVLPKMNQTTNKTNKKTNIKNQLKPFFSLQDVPLNTLNSSKFQEDFCFLRFFFSGPWLINSVKSNKLYVLWVKMRICVKIKYIICSVRPTSQLTGELSSDRVTSDRDRDLSKDILSLIYVYLYTVKTQNGHNTGRLSS